MIESEVVSSLDSLRAQSRGSLVLVILGAAFLAFSLYYSVSRLTPLENEIAARRQEVAKLAAEEIEQRKRLADARADLDALRASAESIYSVRVTPSNQVYEIRATAMATGKLSSKGDPQYQFSLFVNSAEATLSSIERVTYRMDHETFKQKVYVATDRSARFSTGYVGWGCLSSVHVTVQLKAGTSQELEFDMCRSLGPEWRE